MADEPFSLDQFETTTLASDIPIEVEAVPRLICRCRPGQEAAIQAALDGAAQSAGYPGQILVRGDPGLPMAAFVLDWGDGSAAFDPVQSAARVGEALDNALAAESFHAESLNPDEAGHG